MDQFASNRAGVLPAVLSGPEKVSDRSVPEGGGPLSSPLCDLAAAARAYAAKKDSANTRWAYDSDWRGFSR